MSYRRIFTCANKDNHKHLNLENANLNDSVRLEMPYFYFLGDLLLL